MKDRNGKTLDVGDWVKVQPPFFLADLRGNLISKGIEDGTIKHGVAFEEPTTLGVVIARVASVRVIADGLLVADHVLVTWLAQSSGSQRQEAVPAGDCLKVLSADGSDVG